MEEVCGDLTGRRLGALVILDRHKRASWVSRCDCGNTTTYCTSHLNIRRSCGCKGTKFARKHGETNGRGSGRGTPCYELWRGRRHEHGNRLCRSPSSSRTSRSPTCAPCWGWHLNPMSAGNNSPPLDRLTPSTGYVPGNVRVVCTGLTSSRLHPGEHPQGVIRP